MLEHGTRTGLRSLVLVHAYILHTIIPYYIEWMLYMHSIFIFIFIQYWNIRIDIKSDFHLCI